MKKFVLLLTSMIAISSSQAQFINYAAYPVYTGNDLGLHYSAKQSSFRIWSPSATKVNLLLYNEGTGGRALGTYPLTRSVSGTWTLTIKGDQKGKFYAFKVLSKDSANWSMEVTDPYVKLVGINGKRGMIASLNETDPVNWSLDKSPPFTKPTDAIIYELHVRDASIAANSGIRFKGKFKGLIEKGTKNEEGLSTGLDHFKELGVTHIHLLPSFDYNSVDESSSKSQYNWGYDPVNYNTPEGSYSTNAADGRVRVKEFKELIKTFHDNGLRVVMDVVYNHTALTSNSIFNQLVPGYYYRQNKNGNFSDATACGNEMASERAMDRKFMLESVKYWVEEFHVDGFRFDLMGVHDIETMNLISKELHRIKPSILLYGEGWTAGTSPLPDSTRALKANVSRLENIAVFSDDIRDGVKGSVFDHDDKGFASGKPGMEQSIRFGIVASCSHPQVEYSKVNYSKAPYAKAPGETVTYVECHDNHALWDKLAISAPGVSTAQRQSMQQLALSIVLTSQGISFLHAGTEFLRSKKGVENSFNSGDAVNAIDWSEKTKHKDVFEYVRQLIRLRKDHPAFRMTIAKDIQQNIKFTEGLSSNIISYTLNGAAVNDNWKNILVSFNGSGTDYKLTLPEGNWQSVVMANEFVSPMPASGTITLKPYSCSIIYVK